MRGPGTVHWTPAMLDEASRLWGLGWSASQIAKAMGVRRNAILGVSFRDRARFPFRDADAEARAVRKTRAA